MIYLDHAATSHPKPPAVLAAIAHWFSEIGVSPARGDSARCRAAAEIVERTRAALGRLCGLPPARVAFTSGATEAANLFLHGFLRDGDTVVATAAEHSAVARPLRALADAGRLALHVLPTDRAGHVDATGFGEAVHRVTPRLVCVNHASNVTGAVQDARALCAIAHQHGATTLLDASQTAGVLDVADVRAGAVIASAHKSLLGPPGLGFLAVREGVELRAVKHGGTGSSAALDRQPQTWPIGFEPGTPNMPAIAGLGAALAWLDEQRPGSLLAHALEIVDLVARELRTRLGDDVQFVGTSDRPRIGILSFTLRTLDPAEAGLVLDAAGIHVRTGFHCAPWVHECLGTQRSGTVRVSPGPWITADEARAVARALAP